MANKLAARMSNLLTSNGGKYWRFVLIANTRDGSIASRGPFAQFLPLKRRGVVMKKANASYGNTCTWLLIVISLCKEQRTTGASPSFFSVLLSPGPARLSLHKVELIKELLHFVRLSWLIAGEMRRPFSTAGRPMMMNRICNEKWQ